MSAEDFAEEFAAVSQLRRHLALPRPLRAAHAVWLRWRAPAIARALESMLALADEPDTARLDATARVVLTEDDSRRVAREAFHIGDRLGPWRIASLLGAGGMGQVFRAHRDDGAYLQQVAIKRMRAGVASEASTEAFLREREILARLNHPGISRLIDGGVDAEGRPWLAMELIEGEPIDLWCDRRKKNVGERTALFLHVCEAVQDAHRHGVLHGDIKPENILVDADGRSKLVDFGVAALLEDADGDAFSAGFTEGYAAPERLAHEARGFASDIYALGMVLCRLLLGAAPPRGPASALCALLDADGASTVRPQTLLDGATDDALRARGLPHRRALAALIDGDLGAILDKCLRTCPEDRYDSAAALADDLRAWSQARPIAATGRRSGYRLRKALSRHRRSVAAAAVVGAAFALGVGYSRFAAGAAEARLSELQALLEDSLGPPTAIESADAGLSPRTLLARAEARLRRSERVGEGTTLAYGLLALSRSYLTVGDYDRALALTEEAREYGDGNRRIRERSDAARAAILNHQARYREAEQVARETLGRRNAFASLFDAPSSTIWVRAELARALWHQGHHREGMARLDAAIADARRDTDATTLLSELLTQRARWKTDLYDTDSAMRDLEQALRTSEGVHPHQANHARLAMVRALLRMNRQAQARTLAQKALTVSEAIYGPDHPETARALLVCAEAILHTLTLETQQYELALGYTQRAKRILSRTLGERHPLYTESLKYSAYARALAEDGDDREILAEARESLALLRASTGATFEQQISAKIVLANILSEYSLAPKDDAMLAEALTLYAEIEAQTANAGIPIPHELSVYARALNDRGDSAEAARVLHRANAEILRYLGPKDSMLIYNRLLLAKIAYNAGDDAQAGRLADSVLRDTAQRNGAGGRLGWTARFDALRMKADLAERGGDAAAAARIRREAIVYATAMRDGDPDHPRIRELQRQMQGGGPFRESSS